MRSVADSHFRMAKEYKGLIQMGAIIPIAPSDKEQLAVIKHRGQIGIDTHAAFGSDPSHRLTLADVKSLGYKWNCSEIKIMHDYMDGIDCHVNDTDQNWAMEAIELQGIYNGSQSTIDQLWFAHKLMMTPVYTSRFTWQLRQHILPKYFKDLVVVNSELAMKEYSRSCLLPSVDSLPVKEITALRANAECYDNWRKQLQLVLQRTQERTDRGEDPERVLREELLPLHDSIRKIDTEIKKSKLSSLFSKKNRTSFIVGASTLTNMPILNAIDSDHAFSKDFVKLGSTALAILIYFILFERPSSGKLATSNVYHAVFDK